MAIYAEFDQNGVWQNTVTWDGVSAYAPPPGWTLELVSSLPPGGTIGATLANGQWTAPVPPAPIVPTSVAMWQAKAALQAAGLLASAQAAVTAANDPVLTEFWADASSIDRSSPTLASIATTLKLTPAQVDALFIAAAGISL